MLLYFMGGVTPCLMEYGSLQRVYFTDSCDLYSSSTQNKACHQNEVHPTERLRVRRMTLLQVGHVKCIMNSAQLLKKLELAKPRAYTCISQHLKLHRLNASNHVALLPTRALNPLLN
ncbi:hypothetical protein Tco_0122182 [Tanacetum coccineum]